MPRRMTARITNALDLERRSCRGRWWVRGRRCAATERGSGGRLHLCNMEAGRSKNVAEFCDDSAGRCVAVYREKSTLLTSALPLINSIPPATCG